MNWVQNWGVVEWVAVCVFADFFWDLAKNILEARRKYRRMGRRKQDWTPREDPALWREG